MRRKIEQTLKAWRKDKKNECLLINGARQVGKTYSILEFGESEYGTCLVIDFIKDSSASTIFEGDLDVESIMIRITARYPGLAFEPGDTLIFLDEIQECPRARTSLKYFAQDDRYDVIASGSLLGIKKSKKNMKKAESSIPVGYE